MSKYFNHDQLQKAVLEILSKDMNECLDATVDKVVADMKSKVRANVAARMIALVQSDYSMEYMRGELRVTVKVGEA